MLVSNPRAEAGGCKTREEEEINCKFFLPFYICAIICCVGLLIEEMITMWTYLGGEG